MARKTRSQKIIAKLRRQINTTKFYNSNRLETPAAVNAFIEPTVVKDLILDQKTKNAQLSNNTDFIKRDLLKTIVISLLVISIELMLYWVFEINNQKTLINLLGRKIF